MGAQKKCFLLLNTIICFIFFTFILITFLKDYFFSSKTKNKNNNDAIFIIIIIIQNIQKRYKINTNFKRKKSRRKY